MKNIVRVVLLMIVAGVIFRFSSQTYEQQSLIPLMRKVFPGEPFAEVLGSLKLSYAGGEISVESLGYYYFIEFFIRKFAHLFLFGCLAAALFGVLVVWRPDEVWKSAIRALMGTGLYATIDEFHQMLTGGRSPLLTDVFIDLTGGLIALVIVVPLYRWKQRKRKEEVIKLDDFL
ncbi:VanZ family protein [Bacillus sp. REN10]|uniref:VanZ family protein n=1 Tax=Bacillus sp. REN10 TaxID=2782541 RepID=UPI001EEDA3DF|nr:VanZ family protein [Bacillus sp. REN10]